MSVSYGGSNITFDDGSTVTSGWSGFKNRIINGAMVIDQRNGGSSVGSTTGYAYGVDRNRSYNDGSARWNLQRVVDAPEGFKFSYKLTVTTAQSSYTSGQLSQLMEQAIEGFNISDLNWGTASSKPITVSFWVKSSLTGSFPLSVFTLSSGNEASYTTTYTINSENTWEYKTVTIPGATIGVWGYTNDAGMYLAFGGAGGSSLNGTTGWQTGFKPTLSSTVNLLATNGATWQITGVQLEKGSTASSFEYRPYTTELQLCERYHQILSSIAVMLPWGSGTQIVRISNSFKTTMRANPSITMGTKTGGTGTMGAASVTTSGVMYFGSGNSGDVIEYQQPIASIEL
jgi:hypothetical protein